MKKIIISLVLVCVLTITPVENSYASAGTIVVSGGSIAIGGLAAGSLAGLAGPAVVIVFSAMLAMGMDVELSRASQEAGMTKTQYVKSKIEQYCNEANITAGVFYKGITDGASVVKNGTFTISKQAATQIKQFCNWLWNTNQVSSSAAAGENTININGIGYPYGTTYQFTGSSGNVFAFTTSKNVAWMKLYYQAGKGCVAMVGNEAFTVNITRNGSAYNSYNSLEYNGYYYQYVSSLNESFSDPNHISLPQVGTNQYSDSDNMKNFINSITNWDMSNTGVVDGFTGSRDDYNNRSGALDPEDGEYTYVNPGLIGQISVPSSLSLAVM